MNPDIPLWARVYSLAYARHGSNGHTHFGEGDLLTLLGTHDATDGTFHRCKRSSLHTAIKTAVKYGFLLDGSSSDCLIAPIGIGKIVDRPGSPFARCPVCDRKSAKKAA